LKLGQAKTVLVLYLTTRTLGHSGLPVYLGQEYKTKNVHPVCCPERFAKVGVLLLFRCATTSTSSNRSSQFAIPDSPAAEIWRATPYPSYQKNPPSPHYPILNYPQKNKLNMGQGIFCFWTNVGKVYQRLPRQSLST